MDQSTVLDCSRHANRILEYDLDLDWVRVQLGLVLDQLNHALAADGVFFPRVSRPAAARRWAA